MMPVKRLNATFKHLKSSLLDLLQAFSVELV